jgi:hypothetical protein
MIGLDCNILVQLAFAEHPVNTLGSNASPFVDFQPVRFHGVWRPGNHHALN